MTIKQINTTAKIAAVVAALGLIAIAFVSFNIPVKAEKDPSGPNERGTSHNFTFYRATTTNATSTAGGLGFFKIVGAKKVTMYFTHGGTATTSTAGAAFKVETSRDGAVWNVYNKLLGADLSSTATSTYTIQGA